MTSKISYQHFRRLKANARGINPAAEARMMKELLDGGMTQADIGRELHIDRSQVSKRVKLLRLIPELLDQLEKGDLKPSIGRELAGMSTEEQEKYLKRDSVTLRDVKPQHKTGDSVSVPEYDLIETEEQVLKDAHRQGLLTPGSNLRRKPMDKVAEEFGMPKTTYSMHLVNARRKIVTRYCKEKWGGRIVEKLKS